MSNELDYEGLSKDVFSLLRKHGLSPVAYGIVLTLSPQEFDHLVESNPRMTHEGVILTKAGIGDAQWFIQVVRQHEVRTTMMPPE
ncbi:hypothetical protein [Kallotenue papyrolyticum]|uniref:hypothetical protein n=1 Tax=Kallotenue papyrolyticum TaxID=1325125 RepID=UPI0012685552|nr:hypothetical protein [Kallotenue papyrolyticum]